MYTKKDICTFPATVYIFLGRTFLCPDSTLKQGDLVIAFDPPKKVDPTGLYMFVVKDGESHTVSKMQVTSLKTITVTWVRKGLSTAQQETIEKINAMSEALKNL